VKSLKQIVRGEHSGETVELFGNDIYHVVGPDASFTNCHVRIRGKSYRTLLIRDGVRFDDCTIEIVDRLELMWTRSQVVRSSFVGCIDASEFGSISAEGKHGMVADSDFSRAEMSAMRFNETDMSRIILPPWPIFCVLNPLDNIERLKSIGLPDSLVFVLENSPPWCTGSVMHAEWVTRYEELDTEVFRERLLGMDYIKIRGE